MSDGHRPHQQQRPAEPTELELLFLETNGQMQRGLRSLHAAVLNRQTELRWSARAFADSGDLELRRHRLEDELRHNTLMAGRAGLRGDSEEAAYRAGQAQQLGRDLEAAEAELRARDAATGGSRHVSRELLSAMFAEAVDEFQAQLLADMRATVDRLVERDIREMAAADEGPRH